MYEFLITNLANGQERAVYGYDYNNAMRKAKLNPMSGSCGPGSTSIKFDVLSFFPECMIHTDALLCSISPGRI